MSEYSIKNIRNEFKKSGIFYTPKELSLYLKSFIDVEYSEVYDPTCGHGNLLSVFDDSVRKYGQDVHDLAVTEASKLTNSDIKLGDTITQDLFSTQQFDVVIANPPFSISYEPTGELTQDKRYSEAPCLAPKSKADYMFILHCLAKMKRYGISIILCFPGVLYRGNSELKLRRYLIENNYVDTVIHVPGNKFTDTSIATAILILKKNKTTTDVTFINEIEEKSKDNEFLERVVTLDEIQKNSYLLSVNTYVAKEQEKESLDIEELADELERTALASFKNKLLFDKEIFSYNNKDFNAYLDKYVSIINEVR